MNREILLATACVLIAALFTWVSPVFGTTDNLEVIFRNSTELLLVGLGMTLLLATANIDVSVGVALGLIAIVVGRLLDAGVPAPLVAMAGPLAGVFVGLLVATVVVLGRIPPIVGTLGLFGIFRTLIFLALGGQWLSGLPVDLTTLMSTPILGLHLAVWVVLTAYFLVWLFMRRTPFGTHVLAVGNSAERARLAGIPVIRIQFTVFVISGILCGIAATFFVATYRNVEMTSGSLLALEAIAAVVLGGTSLMGGKCSLLGTFLGVLLLRLLQNGLVLVGVSSLWQPVVVGILLLLVLIADSPSLRPQGRLFARSA